MNASPTTLLMIPTILAASSTSADGAKEAGRQRPRRLTGPDPSEFKIDRLDTHTLVSVDNSVHLVWDSNGQAKYNMNFGAGNAMPYRNMRDLDVADLDGDGKKEIIVATDGGMIVALDCQCRKLWARRLPSPPTVIKALPARGPRQTQILVGCEDGGVLVLAIPSVGDRRSPTEWAGTPIQSARLTGSPTDIVTLETGDSIIAILGTDGGQVAGYRF